MDDVARPKESESHEMIFFFRENFDGPESDCFSLDTLDRITLHTLGMHTTISFSTSSHKGEPWPMRLFCKRSNEK